MLRDLTTAALVAASVAAAPAMAQDSAIERAGAMLAGAWQTTAPVPAAEGDPVALTMHVAGVNLIDVDNAFYAELARADAVHEPYRQAIFQLYEYDGELRLRTYEFRNVPGVQPTLVGLWAAPEVFPQLKRDDLIATLDVVLEPDGEGFAGSTPHPYPTGRGGAVAMTSSVTLTPDSLVTADQGFGPDGSVVWGQAGDATYTFERAEPGARARVMNGGLVVIDFEHPEADLVAGPGVDVTVDYAGWVQDLSADVATGSRFASSEADGRPFTFPLPGRLIEGWNRGIPGATVGTVRRLVIPAELGYGDRVAAGGAIPANSTLFFEVVVLDLMQRNRPAGGGATGTEAEQR